ncbi:uncharacterized protein LOC113308523 isoform X1 [Papaver somniferum]|uniref:uncharacterized protein LOC113308523 isoform X1 n=1 Tax=Papaver somniferum TaxID=3469 RepID=UPI000E705957|nr:uncharacterized protein LOC113308523 isoform X1 [Papaver somniferum]
MCSVFDSIDGRNQKPEFLPLFVSSNFMVKKKFKKKNLLFIIQNFNHQIHETKGFENWNELQESEKETERFYLRQLHLVLVPIYLIHVSGANGDFKGSATSDEEMALYMTLCIHERRGVCMGLSCCR